MKMPPLVHQQSVFTTEKNYPIKYYIDNIVSISTDKPQLHGLDLLPIIREEIGKKRFSPEIILYQCKNKHTHMCSSINCF